MRISENILISSLTTMRLGGPARYVCEVETPKEIQEAYEFAKQKNLKTFVLGFGANTIGRDEGFDGVIIINRMRGIAEEQTETGTTLIRAMGGEIWDDVVAYACRKNLTGIEALSKIPSLVGAAPVQNIGAYGQDISDTLVSVEAYDSKTNTYKILKKQDLGFSYRKSLLNTTEKNRYFIISVTLELKPGQMPRPFYNSIEKYIAENNITSFTPTSIRDIVTKIRADKLPDPAEKASSGSFFKNVYLTDEQSIDAENKGYPVHHGKDGHKINSGWLIEQCGFSGQLLHGFRINEKAALVLINESATSYEDLKQARSEIVGKVYDKFGYWLEQEPVEITQ